MKHYLFTVISENSPNEGEEFIVGADDLSEAYEIAENNFGTDCVEYNCRLTDEEAEMSGLDEY